MSDLKQIMAQFAIEIPDVNVQDLVLDSRKVKPGDVFIAIQGHAQDGGQYVAKAFEQGAVLALVDSHCSLSITDEKIVLIDDLNEKIAIISADFYGRVSEKLDLIGVTGTNGKSTITSMIAHLAKACHSSSAVIGTLGWGQPDALTSLDNTTPSCVELQKILSQLHQQHTQLVAMEVSSHGLVQGRTAENRFKVAVFSNLSRDHLDYHGDMDSYADAKLTLFKSYQPEICVFNRDDLTAKAWLANNEFNRCVVYGKAPHDLDISSLESEHYVLFASVQYHATGLHAQLITSWGNIAIQCPLFGEFNLYNVSAAIATLLSLGFELGALVDAIKCLAPVSGRMQAFSAPNKPTCVVDYAHTPDALALALKALQQHVPGKVTCVFGCGGDRDKGKRPLMAKAAAQYANKIIITSDNPRSENPMHIIADVAAGLSDLSQVVLEADRAKAIEIAITQASADDVILIAGKGHEDYQIISNQVLRFCDRAWVQQLLKGQC